MAAKSEVQAIAIFTGRERDDSDSANTLTLLIRRIE